MNNTDLNRTAIIDPNGNALYDNEVIKNVAHRRYFKESMQGNQSLSDPLESSVDQKTRVILCVPIFRVRQVIGGVGGSYNVIKLAICCLMICLRNKEKVLLSIKMEI